MEERQAGATECAGPVRKRGAKRGRAEWRTTLSDGGPSPDRARRPERASDAASQDAAAVRQPRPGRDRPGLL